MGINFFTEDFTEVNYKRLIKIAKQRFSFIFFDELPPSKPHVLWRHDVDFSVHRALKLAEIEAKHDIKSTYFLLLHSEMYNLMEMDCFTKIKEIVKLGHQLGLHFDQNFYSINNQEDLIGKISFEKGILENLFDSQIKAVSFHNPLFDAGLDIKQENLAGLINTYGSAIYSNYKYVSDSNGYWRFDRLEEVLSNNDWDKLQVLTHPEWWVPSQMLPRERVQRCIDGRALAVANFYDNFHKKSGRY